MRRRTDEGGRICDDNAGSGIVFQCLFLDGPFFTSKKNDEDLASESPT